MIFYNYWLATWKSDLLLAANHRYQHNMFFLRESLYYVIYYYIVRNIRCLNFIQSVYILRSANSLARSLRLLSVIADKQIFSPRLSAIAIDAHRYLNRQQDSLIENTLTQYDKVLIFTHTYSEHFVILFCLFFLSNNAKKKKKKKWLSPLGKWAKICIASNVS